MKNKKIIVCLIALSLVAVTYVQGGWEELAKPLWEGAHPGSALCGGTSIRQGMPTDWVWFLQNHNPVPSWHFSKYDIVNDTWLMLSLPYDTFQPGPGAAIACVNGWIFAFKGGETNEFWVYFDGENTWYRAPDAPQPVIDGGALCYGGVQLLWSVPHYVLYAFTGQSYEVGGDYYGYFWRYAFRPPDPANEGGPLTGRWDSLPNIPGMTHQYFSCLTWLPMDDPDTFPMGLVVAMKNYQEKAHFHLYDPHRNQWYPGRDIPKPTNPREYAKLSQGASITSHYRDSVMFFLGEDSFPRHYGFYDVVNNTVSFGSPTPQPVRGGAAIAAIWRGGNEQSWEGIAYAEFGTQALPDSLRFYRWGSQTEQEGGQGVGINPTSSVKVVLHPNRTSHIFSVKCAPGPVQLSIMDVTGRKLASLSTQSQNGNVDITYNHPIIKSGVYFWKLSSSSGDANGKMVIAK
ncbi:MAG: T9SS type A sorting domain-containing protein [candidate division WOR-3 bacterium]